ncbi:free fatty acid receptor 2-like, partial [Scleropages formosus]
VPGSWSPTMTRHAVILSGYIVTFLIGLPTNILSLCAFSIKVHSKPMSTDILLLNLTVSDLLFLIVLPLKMHEAASEMKWLFPYFLFVFITEYLIAQNTTLNTEICYDNFSGEQLNVLLPVRLEISIVIFLAPLLICTFCYLSCIRILYSQPRICQKKKKKAIGMALGTLLVFVICFLPFNVSHVLGFLEGKSPAWRYYTLLLSAFNTCLDPFIFYFSSSIFQDMVKHFLFRALELCCRIFKTKNKHDAR